MAGEHILVVEDDPAILTGLVAKLELEGYRVTSARDGETARQILEEANPDLIVLDIMLPELDGLAVLRWLRRRDSQLPVLILSARGREEQKVEGLKAGADDYLPKPFGLKELLARVEALLRRSGSRGHTVSFADVSVDLESHRVERAGDEVTLSPKELQILLFLVRRPGRTFPRETIIASVWDDPMASDPRQVDYHLMNLRKKLELNPAEPRYFVTRHGRGFEFVG